MMNLKRLFILVAVFAGAFLFRPVHAEAGLLQSEESVDSSDTQIVMEVVDNREYADLVIAQVDSWVNVRDLPGTNGKVLGKLYNNSVGHFIEEAEDGWVKIQSGSVTGYVKAEYCVRGREALKIAREVEVTIATINTGTLRVRKEPNTTSRILGTFSRGDELEVISTEDGFAKVSYNNDEGYISLDYVELSTEFVEAESIEEERARLAAEKKAKEEAARAARKAEEARRAQEAAAAAAAAGAEGTDTSAQAPASSGSSDLGQQVVDYAVQFVGNPYKYGGTSLTEGIDCGGFVQAVYAYFGVSLPRTGQRNSGYAVGSLDEALPGDIICYSGHVAIYMGNGQIVHAATPKHGICIGSATYTKIIGIRRIF